MVEESKCYITKFGSIHKTEEAARNAEKEEEAHAFATAYCNFKNLEARGHPFEQGLYIYYHRDLIKQLLDTFDFIQ